MMRETIHHRQGGRRMRTVPAVVACAAVLAATSASDTASAARKPPSPRKSERASLPADAAASVNGEILPERIVAAFVQNGQEELRLDSASDDGRKKLEQLHKHVLDEQVDRILIAQEVERRKIAPAQEQIDKAEQNTIQSHGGEERYARFLEHNHFSREDYRHYVLRSALCGEALKAALQKEISVTDEEVAKVYRESEKAPQMQRPERATAAHILINTRRGILAEQLKIDKGLRDGAELDSALDEEIKRRRELAERIRQEALAPGADFAALARKYSEDFGTRERGGNLGTFTKGTHPLALDDVVFELKPGVIGPVVETDFGFHVVKKLDHRPAGLKTLEEAGPQIRTALERQKLGEAMRRWLADARARAKIVVRPAAEAADAPGAKASGKKK